MHRHLHIATGPLRSFAPGATMGIVSLLAPQAGTLPLDTVSNVQSGPRLGFSKPAKLACFANAAFPAPANANCEADRVRLG